jgi:ankyrin repeat protein
MDTESPYEIDEDLLLSPEGLEAPPTPPETRLPLLTSVQFLARGVASIAALPHVLERIDELLDYSQCWTIPRACAVGDVPLLRRVAKREALFPDAWTKDEPLFRPSQFARGCVEAAHHGHLPVIEWLVTEYDRETSIMRAVEEAAKGGHLHILKWMYAHCYRRVYWGGAEMRHAVRKNQFEVAKWLQYNTFVPMQLCLIDEAARHDNMEMLRWLRMVPGECTIQSVAHAVQGGHLQVAQYIQRHCFKTLSMIYVDDAAKNGRMEMAKWLYEHKASISPSAATGAASNGHLEILKWLHEDNIKPRCSYSTFEAVENEVWSAAAMDKAAANGHLEVVQWLHSNRTEGCTTAAMDNAAAHGHLDIVKWLQENRIEGCTAAAMDGAASNGHLDTVRWLHEHRQDGCSTTAMNNAAKNNHLAVVQWLHENRSEGCTTAAMDEAAGSGHLEVVQWLHEHRDEGCTIAAMDKAAAGGHLEVIKWLHATRTEGCTVGAMDGAAKQAHFEVMKWLHEHRIEGCSKAAIDNASGTGRLEIIRWLDDHYSPGCTSRAIERASLRGFFDIILYIYYKRMAPVTADVSARAIYYCNLQILQWVFRDHRGTVDDRRVYRTASEYDRYCLHWLQHNGVEFNNPW